MSKGLWIVQIVITTNTHAHNTCIVRATWCVQKACKFWVECRITNSFAAMNNGMSALICKYTAQIQFKSHTCWAMRLMNGIWLCCCHCRYCLERTHQSSYLHVKYVIEIISSHYSLICVMRFLVNFQQQRMQKILNAQSHLIDSFKCYSADLDYHHTISGP